MERIDKIACNSVIVVSGAEMVLMYSRPVGRASTEVIIRDVGKRNPRKVRFPSNRTFEVK